MKWVRRAPYDKQPVDDDDVIFITSFDKVIWYNKGLRRINRDIYLLYGQPLAMSCTHILYGVDMVMSNSNVEYLYYSIEATFEIAYFDVIYTSVTRKLKIFVN